MSIEYEPAPLYFLLVWWAGPIYHNLAKRTLVLLYTTVLFIFCLSVNSDSVAQLKLILAIIYTLTNRQRFCLNLLGLVGDQQISLRYSKKTILTKPSLEKDKETEIMCD